MTIREYLARISKMSVQKAIEISDLGASILGPEESDQFIRTIEESTPVLAGSRRLTMNAPKRKIDRLAFTSRILDVPATAEADTVGSKPTQAQNELSVEELMGSIGITDQTLEDNIEKASFEETVLTLGGRQVGRDMEELFLLGDTLSGDAYLALIDGWHKRAANQLDGTANADFISGDVESMMDAMFEATDKKFLTDLDRWRFLLPWSAVDAYRNALRTRGTALGDAAQTASNVPPYKGVDLIYVPRLNGTAKAMLTMLDNQVYGIYREVRVEPERLPRQRQTDFIITVRADADFEDENAAVSTKVNGF